MVIMKILDGCDIKSLNLLGNVLAKEYAVKYNAGEAIQHRGKLLQKALLVMYMRLKMAILYASR